MINSRLSVAGAFTFYPRNNYYEDLCERVAATTPGDRIVLATMAFHPEQPAIRALFDELYAAARRGVAVRVLLDAFSFIVKEGASPGPLFFYHKLPKHLPKTFRVRLRTLETLRMNGGEYNIINYPSRPLASPFKHRSHIKFAVVNNYAYIGGCNLANHDHIDLMVGWTDQKTADWLSLVEATISRQVSVTKALGLTDVTKPIDTKTALLLDVGIANQSLIFDTALRLIDTAQYYVYITCQYLPNDITLRKLAEASARGVKVTIVYNHPAQHYVPFNFLHHGVVWKEKRLHPSHLFTRQLSRTHNYLHAKLLATDQGTLIGSHNYVRAGVAFGTAELALLSRDSDFATEAIRTLDDLL